MVNGIPGVHGRFFHRATVNCDVATAWDVVTNHENYTNFTQSPTRLVREGEKERNGLGAVRELGVAELEDLIVREVVNYWEPNKLFGYHVVTPRDHQPSHHQGTVRFFPRGDNRTEWVYSMRMIITPKMVETFPSIYDEFLKGFREFMWDLESECERRGFDIELPVMPPSVEDEAIEWGLSN